MIKNDKELSYKQILAPTHHLSEKLTQPPCVLRSILFWKIYPATAGSR